MTGPLSLRCDTHGPFEGVHLAGEGLHLPTVLVRLLLGLAQGIVVAVSRLGEVSELSGRKQKPGSPTCLVHTSSEVLPGLDNGHGLKMANKTDTKIRQDTNQLLRSKLKSQHVPGYA